MAKIDTGDVPVGTPITKIDRQIVLDSLGGPSLVVLSHLPTPLASAAVPLVFLTTKASTLSGTFRSTTGYVAGANWNGGAIAKAGTGDPNADISPTFLSAMSPYNTGIVKCAAIWSVDSSGTPEGNLTKAVLGTQGISGVSGNLPALEILTLSGNMIPGLDVVAPAVEQINLATNYRLDHFNASPFPALETLNLASCPVARLDLSNNPALVYLDAQFTKLNTIDVSSNTALSALFLTVVPISALDVSANTALVTLEVSSTNLDALDVSANTALMTLKVSSTNLDALDVSANTALVTLEADAIDIAALDLSDLAVLKTVFARSCSNLAIVDISGCIANGPSFDFSNSQVTSCRAVGFGTGGGFCMLNLSGCAMITGASLNQVYTDLAAVSSGIVVVTGNPGVSDPSHDPTIATLKGWTVITA